MQRMELSIKVSKNIKDLSFAKQRYDGVARPLGRSVLFIDALIAAAHMLIAARASSAVERVAAEGWLRFIDAESYPRVG